MKTEIIFIPGIFAKTVSFLFGPYFKDQIHFLQSRGYKCRVAPIFQEQEQYKTSEELKTFILDLLDDGPRNFIVITHSKGGVDILDTLINYPYLKRHIKKIITIQAPYQGSPIADFLTNGKIRKNTSNFVIKAMYKGKVQSLEEMRTDKRQQYMIDNKEEIEKICEEIEYHCVASFKQRKRIKFNSVLKPTVDYMHYRYGLKSDGLVPVESAQLNHANNIVYKNLDHASAVVPKKISNFDKLAFNQLLLKYVSALSLNSSYR